MFEKDYLMRLVSTFLDALNMVLKSIDKDDIEGAKKQIADIYKLLGNTSEFFLRSDIDDILLYFKKEDEGYLKKVKMLAELMYYDVKTRIDEDMKKIILEKAIFLLKHYFINTKEFSFELQNKLKEMQSEFEKINEKEEN